VAGWAPGPGAVRGRVFWQRADGRGVPSGRGAGAADPGGAAAAAANLDPGPGQWRARRSADRRRGWRADLAGPGGIERVRGRAGRGAVVVSLPSAVRGPAATGAAPNRAWRG